MINNMKRPAFLDQKPPPGYIAGLGRGATGFSTRGIKNKQIPKRLQSVQLSNTIRNENGNLKDKEDIEAERIFSNIDSKRNGRNKTDLKKKREITIQEFSNLKRSLKQVTENEWLNIPEASDLTRRNKRNRLQEQLNRKMYSAPDTLLTRNVDLTTLTEEREKLLSKKIDKSVLNKSLSGDNTLLENNETSTNKLDNTKEYLQQLESMNNTSNNISQSEEVKKMRIIFQSYRKSMPKEPQSWIASARLEEKCNRFQTAKNIISEGCQECPRSDDIWLENIRLHRNDIHKCKILVATGIKFVPSSQKLWTKAIELESEDINKLRVVRKALVELPTVEEFWKLAVLYEKEKTESIKILKKALEFLPNNIDLWKALIRMQNYENAKDTLQLMQNILPDNIDTWINTAQLEEYHSSSFSKSSNIFINGFKKLVKLNIKFDYSELIKKALYIENDIDSKLTHELFISSLFKFQPIDSNALQELTKTTESMENSTTKILCLRELLIIKPTKYSLWQLLQTTCVTMSKISELYKTYEIILFDDKTNYSTLRKIPTLSLLYAKDIWKYSSNPDKALDSIDRALKIIPTSPDVWFAKLKILCQLRRIKQIEELFDVMFDFFNKENTIDKERLYLKYVSFLRYMGKYDDAIEYIENKCVIEYPQFYKFYLQIGQIYELEIKDGKQSIFWYDMGFKRFPKNSIFAISLSRVHINLLNNVSKARSILEVALALSPNDERLYQSLIRLEKGQHQLDQVNLLIERALKLLPTSPIIWTEKLISLSDRKSSTKKMVFKDALSKTKNHHLVLLQIAISFFNDGQYKYAEKWLQRSIRSNPNYGDTWVWLVRTYQKLGLDCKDIFHKVNLYEPKYGNEWIEITKGSKTQYLSPTEVLTLLSQQSI